MIISPEERENERILFDTERKRVPDLFLREPTIDDDDALRWIGIEEFLGHRPIGYLKLMPQDFIVEEISRDGAMHTVELGNLEMAKELEGGTYYVDLVKMGISTLEAKDELLELLGLEEKSVGYAGIKDRLALTSQEISLRGLNNPEKLLGINADNFFLKNLRRGKGVLVNGNLKGNRFTITLRTPETITPALKKEMEEKMEDIKADGFWNFFYFQRFGACGTPRLLSHWLGRLLVKGQYEEAVKLFCTRTGPNEIPYINAIREAMERKWGDWNAIMALIDCFPLYFSYEHAFIGHIMKKPDDFLGALRLFPDQIRLWVYAYACYLFNRKISELIKKGKVPLALPFITSYNPNDWKPYQKFLDEDGVTLPSRAYQDFPFLYIQSRTCPTLQKLTVHNVVFKDKSAVFSFSLPKGSYATTFLMNFFTLTTGLPIVPGISSETIDPFEILGVGTLAPLLKRFKTVLDNRQMDLEGNINAVEK